MPPEALISYAQNGEDVVIWRALGHVAEGRYVDVGACDPVELSVTKALYDRGWRGIDIDPVPDYAARLRAARPGNEVVEAAITDRDTDSTTFHQLVDTGLSTLLDDTAAAHEEAGFERRDIIVATSSLDAVCERSSLLRTELHLLKIDVEGAEAEVLRSFDLDRWAPWVVVVEATRPLSTDPSYADWDPLLTEAGYEFALFDGLSRYYVSPRHLELRAPLSYPACALDDYVPVAQHRQDVRVDQLTAELQHSRNEVLRWRNEAVTYWANAVASGQSSQDHANEVRSELDRAQKQLAGMRETLREVRGDRRRLRAQVKRLKARIEMLRSRDASFHTPSPRSRARARLGHAVRRIRG